jgi:hypothetical protein
VKRLRINDIDPIPVADGELEPKYRDHAAADPHLDSIRDPRFPK